MNFQDQEADSAEPLHKQPIGYQGVVKDLSGSDEIVERLRELGFVRGSKVILHQRSPFGDPLIVQVGDTIVALRGVEAKCITI